MAIVALATLVACGEDSKTTAPAGDPGPIDVTGSWYSVNETANRVPLSQYDIVQSGSTLTGEAFWVWEGALERIGPLTGTIDARGNAEWTTTLNDNGWNGTEVVTARFSGVSARAGVASSDAERRGGGTVSGAWTWYAPDGSPRDGGQFTLDRPPLVVPAPGTGPLGEAGYWRGAMLYVSAGGCHTAGFLLTMSLSSEQDIVVGSASAKPWPRGAALPDTLPDWFGPLQVEVSGLYDRSDNNRLSLELTGDITGLFDGNLVTMDSHTQYLGTFVYALPCNDSSGSVEDGTIIFNSEVPVP